MAIANRGEGLGGGVRGGGSISRGAKKVQRRVNELNEIADARTGGSVRLDYKKNKLTDVVGGTGSKNVKPRNLGKVTKQMAPSAKTEAKRYAKRDKSVGPMGVAKVPVKKKSK